MYKNIQECILYPKDVYFGGLSATHKKQRRKIILFYISDEFPEII